MLIWPALFGLAWGSFLGVVRSRFPRRASILRPPSHCPHCRHRLAPWELVPIVSFLALRGRCRGCGSRTGWREPLLEAASALSLAAGWQAAGAAGAGAAAVALLALVLAAAARERTGARRQRGRPTRERPAARQAAKPTHCRPNPGEAGFTLAEVAVSAALTALVAAGVFSTTATLAGFLAAREQRQAAVVLARARLEDLRGLATLPVACNAAAPIDDRLTPDGFRVESFISVACDPGELGARVANVTVTVTYQRTWSGQSEEVVLAMVRRDPL